MALEAPQRGGSAVMLCIASAGMVTALAVSSFTLDWTHSVERTQWSENWLVTEAGLQLVEASVEGAGAGIDLPDDAVLANGRWSYRPNLPPLETLTLAASGMTATPWTLCSEGQECLSLGEAAGETVRLWVGEERCRG
ncbi:DUF1850 domain-containing protein [Devosia albogilva]|uniref:DUF1850 domain-containing protein n=1 Tax=Devosia albogilva TaxID=429726 RepID=A0ABW5QM57_9HYPH